MRRTWNLAMRTCVLGLCALACGVLFGAPKEVPSRLDIAAQPAGALVAVDGQSRGAVPCSLFDLTPGAHFIAVTAPNHVPAYDFVTLETGGFAQKSFTLDAEKALILVKTSPVGADVRCNGVSLGTTPLLITSLAAGRRHTLDLMCTGYQTKRIDVTAEGRQPLVREETLALDSGVVACTTEPAGATVLVNGVERGVTPVRLTHVPKGVATIVFRLEGYREETRELRLAPGDEQTLAVQLKGLPAKLTLVSTPEQAKVFVDDAYQGKTPTAATGLQAGDHVVRLELAGHAPVTRTVHLANGEAKTEEFRLESVLGRLEITTTPPGAKILLDGKVVGTTRSPGSDATRSQVLALEGIDAGEHAVQVRRDGFQDASRRVVVTAKETSRLFVRLSRVFRADTEIETIRGVHRGAFVEKDFLGNITLEISPGVLQTFRAEDIRSIKVLAK